jgi:diguanylate cyclase (GGDEF)-like protein
MRGRHGGEEFAVLLPGVSAEGAFELAEKIAKNSPCCAISSATVRRSIRPSASASPASSRKPRDAGDLVREADAALYQAERDGRDRVMSAPRAIAVRKRFAA